MTSRPREGQQVDSADEEAFRSFIVQRSPTLLRTAYLLVNDRERAEDLLQTALVKTYQVWHRIRDISALEGYVRRTMATTAISWWRQRRHREEVVEHPPDQVGPDDAQARLDRDALWDQLRRLPAQQRAVIVLRYYEDLSESEIAGMLGVSAGAVKRHASRALATLRGRITEENEEVRRS